MTPDHVSPTAYFLVGPTATGKTEVDAGQASFIDPFVNSACARLQVVGGIGGCPQPVARTLPGLGSCHNIHLKKLPGEACFLPGLWK